MEKLKTLSLAFAFALAVTSGLAVSSVSVQAQIPADSIQQLDPDEQKRINTLNELRQQARARGISETTIQQALHDDLKPRESVVRADRTQAEFRETFEDYRDKRVTQFNIDRGRNYLNRYRSIFEEAETRYGVQAEYIAATWAIETNLGNYIGKNNIFENLFTLVWDGRRADFMTEQLMVALEILDEGHVEYDDFISSFAGAFGQSQFLPTSYRDYAVDGNNNGTIDLFNEIPDVIHSIANYHARHGWRAGERASREVMLPAGIKDQFKQAADAEAWKPLQEWKDMGITKPDGNPIPVVAGMNARLVLPDGVGGSAHLVYNNHRTIMRYNPAHKYALTTQSLADIYSY